MLTGGVEQKADPWQLCRTGLLCTSSERPGRRAAEKCDELAPPHATPDLRGRQSIRRRTLALRQLLHREVPGRAMSGRGHEETKSLIEVVPQVSCPPQSCRLAHKRAKAAHDLPP